ncbi:MAG: NAD-dependent epimerase/dehydratase family protein [Gemmatimonadaceae bacterium]
MKIFVAGATGVIGGRLVPLLIESGHDVTGVARSPEKKANLESQRARPVSLDVFDADAVARAVAGHDVVINVATHIPPTSRLLMPGAFKENDRLRREASHNLSKAAIMGGANRFIQESFAAAYPDRSDEFIDESVPLAPAPYVRTVLDAERAATEFTKRGGVGIALRFAFFYGPESQQTRDMINLVEKRIAPIPGDPNAFISSIWISDAAAAVVAALNAPAGVYNVTDDKPVRRRDAFNALAGTLGVKPPHMLPEWLTKVMGSVGETLGRSLRLSNTRLREATGWSPRVRSIVEGWSLLAK